MAAVGNEELYTYEDSHTKEAMPSTTQINLNGNPVADDVLNQLNGQLQGGQTVIIKINKDTTIDKILFKESGSTSHLVFEGPGHLTITDTSENSIRMPSADNSTITVEGGAHVTIHGNITIGDSSNTNNKIYVMNQSTCPL